MNRRLLGFLGAVALGLVGVFVLVAYVQGAEDRALEGEELVDVLVLNQDVPAGTPAEELTESVELESVQRKVVSAGAVADLDQISGLITSADLLAREQLTTFRFVTPDDFRPERGSVEVPDGLVEVAVPLGPSETIGGVIRPGDRVAVAATLDGVTPFGDTATALLMQQVLVTNVQGSEIPQAAEGADRAEAPAGGLLVTVAVEASEMARLVYAVEHGQIYLGLQTDDDPIVSIDVQTGEVIYGAEAPEPAEEEG